MEQLRKNNLGQWSIEEVETLEKANTPTFEHGSIVHLNKASTGHGYSVIEEKKNGERVHHPDIKYSHLDTKCQDHNGLLRIEDSKHKHKDLYHQMRVEHTHRTTHDSMLGSRSHVTERLHPHGESWRKGVPQE